MLQTPGITDPVGRFLGPERIERQAPGRIDWIFARGFRCVDAGIVDNGASGHPMVWAELELLPLKPLAASHVPQNKPRSATRCC